MIPLTTADCQKPFGLPKNRISTMPEIVYIFLGERTETISGSKMPAGLLLRARTYHLSFDQVGFL